jgi:hypothetical protein
VKGDIAADLGAVTGWCRTVVRFLGEGGHLSKPMQAQLEAVIANCEQKRDLRGMRHVQRDLRQMIRLVGKPERARLDSILSALQGPTSDVERDIAQILTRGTVETEDEYRLLMDRVNEIFQDPAREGELAAINKALLKSKFS